MALLLPGGGGEGQLLTNNEAQSCVFEHTEPLIGTDGLPTLREGVTVEVSHHHVLGLGAGGEVAAIRKVPSPLPMRTRPKRHSRDACPGFGRHEIGLAVGVESPRRTIRMGSPRRCNFWRPGTCPCRCP